LALPGALSPGRFHARLGAAVLGAIAAVVWCFVPVISAVARASGDPSNQASYYKGLLGFLATQDPTRGRLEIPFTREHWEAAYVAPAFPIARGWERQLDNAYNAQLYRPLTASTYRQWLDASAVDLVAIPDVPLDYGGVAERDVLAHPPDYLTEVYRDAHWRVYRVSDPTPMVTGPATLTSLGPTSMTLDFDTPGVATVKVHASTLWKTDSDAACIDGRSKTWLAVEASEPGAVTLTTGMSVASVLQHSSTACDSDGD